ncbi:hypothetical protein [Aquincola sp. J276]|uniref:hypothetical protein n=1 Tax=Aquincola sp. J276 TaxID=2898432 RepID=UPI0021507B58|nr:hypothetical protein [Aquincola sp. J276]MCR5868506.1 hypothetical protein [Aquincola sp. J276]
MNAANVFKAALFGFLEDELPGPVAHFEALVVLRGYLAASPGQAAAGNASKLHEYMKGLISSDAPEQMGLILKDPPNGGVTTIPGPGCMAARLPLGRRPTPQEIRDAWDACCGSQP